MKIIAIVRTKNEERNVGQFCQSYAWADAVLVADGGSTDGTVNLAWTFPNATVRIFTQRKELQDGYFVNPPGAHLNFLIDWGTEEGADWLIFDDCDCWPNPALIKDARQLLEESQHPAAFAYRLHLWGPDQFFPKMSLGLGEAGRSLWAWRPAVCPIRGDETTRGLHIDGKPGLGGRLDLDPPYCLLHNPYPDEEAVAEKIKWYRAWGVPFRHPLEGIYAPPEPLPGWVYAGE